MKRLYAAFLGLALIGGASLTAQNLQINGTKPVYTTPKAPMANRTLGTYFMDYDAYDATLLTINHYAGISNNGVAFTHNESDTLTGSFYAAYTAFDSLIVTQDYTNFNYINNNAVVSVLVDSVFIWVDHLNGSGMNDTIKIDLVSLDGTNRPTETSFWNFNEVTNTTLGQGVLGYAPNQLRTGANWKFGVRVKYNDPSKLDTFNIIFGQIENCLPSEVYPATYYRANVGPNISQLLPTAAGAAYWYQDCNGNSTPDWPDENSFSHWGIWAKVTVVDNMGVEEQDAKGIKMVMYPNPASEVSNIRFELEKDADMQMMVTDLSGHVVYTQDLGKKAAGVNLVQLNTSDYASGMYMVTLNYNGSKITRRLIVK